MKRSRAVVVAFHNYCPTNNPKYFKVVSDFFVDSYNKYWKDEVDRVYVIDSTWGFDYEDEKFQVIKVSEHLRYYEAYKECLPKIKEDLVLYIDNDMVINKKSVVSNTFEKLEDGYDVVSIYDTIGKYHFDELGGQSKFCPYWFAAETDTLKRYRYVDWGPDMPNSETLGRLTFSMLGDGLKPYEIEEDKTDFPTKKLGYYHIRAGSTVPYLLTTKEWGDPKTYWNYINNQPEAELLRHCDWYDYMGGDSSTIRKDLSEKNNSSTN